MKKQIIFNPGDGSKSLMINGKRYRLKKEIKKGKHLKSLVFEEFDEVAEKKHKETVDMIVHHILKDTHLTATDVLCNALEYFSEDELNRFELKVRRKVKAKVGRGCLEIILGRDEIEIMN